MPQMVFILRRPLNVHIPGIPVPEHGYALRSPVAPDAELRVTEPFGHFIGTQGFKTGFEALIHTNISNHFLSGHDRSLCRIVVYTILYHSARALRNPLWRTLLRITCPGNRYNGFGQLHLIGDDLSWVGPDSWRTEGVSWTDTYQVRPMGILSAPLVKGPAKVQES